MGHVAKAPKNVRAFLKKMAKRGGRARAKKLTKEQRRASAQRAAKARWMKHGESLKLPETQQER